MGKNLTQEEIEYVQKVAMKDWEMTQTQDALQNAASQGGK